jgi:hypothetical protein
MAIITVRKFLNDLSQVVAQTSVNQSVSLANGSCPNMEQYHRRCGRIEGMGEVLKLAREMLGQLESATDNDRLPEMPNVTASGNG